jgi:protein ImuB
MRESPIVVCVLLPRLALTVAVGSRSELFGVPVALAPASGQAGGQQIGEVSLAAEAFGIRPGMRLGEALSRCPRLVLIPPDPAGVAERWEEVLSALESLGARVEASDPGIAYFDVRGLLPLHGGLRRRGPALGSGPLPAADREALGRLLAAAREAIGTPARFGVAPSRFAALAAATRARVRRPVMVSGGPEQARAFLAGLPVALLRGRAELAALPPVLERLGITTLGELAALPPAAAADRFGSLGLDAHRLARGEDRPLRPRVPGELVRETMALPEAAGGLQLARALEVLIDRLLARPERRGRTLRTVVLSAALVEAGGTWRQPVTFREALADAERMRLALVPRLALLPAPAQTLTLAVERFGHARGDQRALLDDSADARRARLREAVRQTRAAAGREAAMRILEVDPDSRLPERRAVLTLFEG